MRIGRFAWLAAALILGGATPPAPGRAEPGAEELAEKAQAKLDRGEYLAGLDGLERAAARPDAGGMNGIAAQMLNQARPMVEGYAPPPAHVPGQPPLAPALVPQLAAARPRDAVASIAAAARGTRVVILNEAHHSPRGRAFALEVARALRPLGYRFLAAEAFVNHKPVVDAMAREGFPRRNMGFYLQDPVFADFVRQALSLGYEPVAYEETGEQVKSGPGGIPGREQAEADNLAAAIAARPRGKWLVYVGFSHVAEAPIAHGPGSMTWMAARLKRQTGIDPLTVDQTGVSEDTLSRSGRDAWVLVAPRLRRSSVLFTGGRALVVGPYAGAVDLQVVHPPTRLSGGRPDWLASLGRRPRDIPFQLLPKHGRRLIQSFLAAEPVDAVPIDQVLVEAGKPVPKLMLPQGSIRYAVQDPEPEPRPKP
jgi:hypothetical protein